MLQLTRIVRRKKKRFTLIELLAVIVILALIMAVVIPNVTWSLNNSKLSTLHSKEKSLTNSFSEAIITHQFASDMSGITSHITDDDVNKIETTSGLVCLNGLSSTLKKFVELNDTDYVLGGTPLAGNADPSSTNMRNAASNVCSAVRTKDGVVEVVLVAKSGGRFFYPGKTITYAWSVDTKGTAA